MSEVYPTPPEVLEALQIALNGFLSLSNRTQEAHWNVKGPSFGSLHELFGGFYDFLIDGGDLIAERVVQLSGQAKAAPSGGPLFGDDVTLIKSLVDMSKDLSAELKAGMVLFNEELGDEVTGDICIELGRELEKWVWKIEAHIQQVVQVN
jgi:starvation-inducible DNA-binding protein